MTERNVTHATFVHRAHVRRCAGAGVQRVRRCSRQGSLVRRAGRVEEARVEASTSGSADARSTGAARQAGPSTSTRPATTTSCPTSGSSRPTRCTWTRRGRRSRSQRSSSSPKATGRHCASRSRVPSWTAPTRWPPASRAHASCSTRSARHSRLRECRRVGRVQRPAPIERAEDTDRERQPNRGPAACRGRRSELRTARRSGGHRDDRDGGGTTRLRQRLDVRAAAPAGDGGRHESVRAARPQRLGVRPVGDADVGRRAHATDRPRNARHGPALPVAGGARQAIGHAGPTLRRTFDGGHRSGLDARGVRSGRRADGAPWGRVRGASRRDASVLAARSCRAPRPSGIGSLARGSDQNP